MGDLSEDPEEIGEIVDEREDKDEKKKAFIPVGGGEEKSQEQDGQKGRLERADERHVPEEEKKERCGVDDGG